MKAKYQWENYLIIEGEFIEAKRYLSFDRQANYEADSPFLHNQIVLLGSLVEIAMKKLIELRTPDKSFSPGNISDYKRLLLIIYPEIDTYKTQLVNTDIEFLPFSDWSKGKLSWWEAYSKIKHGSSRLPKLEHALNLLAAYEILLHLIHREEAIVEGSNCAFYSFRDMPRLLILQFNNFIGQDETIGFGYNVENYKTCEDDQLITSEIELIKKEREEKKSRKDGNEQ